VNRSLMRAAMIVGGGAVVGLFAARRLRRALSGDLTGKVALVTGGSRGLGFLVARDLGRLGCKLVICARDEAELARAREDLARDASDVMAIRCDVSDGDDVDRMVRRAEARFGRIDVLVNNAGIIEVGPLDSMSRDDFARAMDVMFWGTLNPTLAVLPGMRERREGRIVNITSIGAKISVPHLLPYGSAKFAALGLSEGLRAELAGSGVSVTSIVPGLMRTGSHLNARFKGDKEKEYAWFSLGATLPLVSMDAERAARQIVAAARGNEAERILSIPAKIVVRLHGLFPGLVTELLGLTNRFLLPETNGDRSRSEAGRALEGNAPGLVKSLTGLGRAAARRFHQHPGPVRIEPAR
jgi:NAD(P)-dependent dehydrogenase (short-subunit alcohol dehydrogenase family)